MSNASVNEADKSPTTVTAEPHAQSETSSIAVTD